MAVRRFFDFIFYRLYMIYERTSKDGSMASGILAVIQTGTLLSISWMLLSIYFDYLMHPAIAALLIIPNMTINWYLYDRKPKIKEFHKRWSNVNKEKLLVYDIVIIIYLILVLTTPIIFATLKVGFS